MRRFIRFMSEAELEKYLKGEPLINEKDHKAGGKQPMGFVLTNTETKDNPLFKMRPNASREELTDIMVMSMVAHIANDRGVLVKDYVKNMLYNAKRMNRGLGV